VDELKLSPRSNRLCHHQSERRDGRRGLIIRLVGLVGIAIITLLDPATSADGGCEKFAWSIVRDT